MFRCWITYHGPFGTQHFGRVFGERSHESSDMVIVPFMDLEINGFKVHVDQQFAKALAGKLFLIVSEPRKETSVDRAVIYNQIIVKCQVKLFKRILTDISHMSCES